jgi:hypothetical protein
LRQACHTADLQDEFHGNQTHGLVLQLKNDPGTESAFLDFILLLPGHHTTKEGILPSQFSLGLFGAPRVLLSGQTGKALLATAGSLALWAL